MRLGYVTGPSPLLQRVEMHQQATNLHASGKKTFKKVISSFNINIETNGDNNKRENCVVLCCVV
jgi:homoserine acetyltransferase